jgi:ribonucleoside-diphosphate reductase alpha chain
VISYTGHLRMMAALQPFFSGAMSKTVNLPESATVGDIQQLLIDSWRSGIKCVAIYRDNCKVSQPLNVGNSTDATGRAPGRSTAATPAEAVAGIVTGTARPTRERLPRTRPSKTFEFRVADCKGFVTVGEYEDGRPGELFLNVSKQGSTLSGIMDAFAISVSHGLQYGVPLEAFVGALVGMRFEPAGMTDDPEVRIANSLVDYLFRRLAIEYLPLDVRESLGVLGTSERVQPTLPGMDDGEVEAPRKPVADAPLCMSCGVAMNRAGSCFVCSECGSTSGCS